MKVKSLSHVRPSATPWIAAYQAPPSMGFSRQEYWSGVPLPSLPKWLIIHLKKKGPQISHYHNVLTVFSDSDKEAVGGEHLPFSLHLDIGLGVYSHKRECVMKRNGNKQITIPKGRKKKKSLKSHFHSPLFILAHSGKITQKPVTNHLNLRLSTFLCFASQTVMCSSQRVKKPDSLSHTVALCEQYGGPPHHCRGSC